MSRAIGASLADSGDYGELDALWQNPTVIAAVRNLGWAVNDFNDWTGRVPIFRDATGIQFAIVTRDKSYTFAGSSGASLQLDHELFLYVGPRPGLTTAQARAATFSCLRAWVNALKAQGRAGTETLWGAVPSNWLSANKQVYTVSLNWAETPIPANDWPIKIAGRTFSILSSTLAQTDSALVARGFP